MSLPSPLSLLAVALALAGISAPTLPAAESGAAVPAMKGFYLTTDEAFPPAAPPTPAQVADSAKHGRPAPPPEVLQPTLDPALQPFAPQGDTTAAATIHGTASDVLAVLSHMWADAFRKFYPNVTVDIPPPYSGRVGAKELVNGNIDFALVSRELVPSDVAAFKEKFGYRPLSVPISGGSYRAFGFLDAIGVIVNKDNPIEKLSFSQLDAVFSKTRRRGRSEVRTWGDLGLTGDWADKPVHVWGVKPWNGFEEFMRERVMCPEGAFVNRGEWRDDMKTGETIFPISPAVAADKYAIGYSGFAYITAGVKAVAVAERDEGPYVVPSYTEIALARYPLCRVIYCNLNKAPGKALNPTTAEFLRFILSRDGQEVVVKHALYMPLRSGQVAHSTALLQD
jgi:phosphate transport system substrate-binding protein